MTTIELKLLAQYAPDSSLLGLAREDPKQAIRYVKALRSEILRLSNTEKYDEIILNNLTEALLSPVDWVRKRAEIVGGMCENN